MPNGLREVSLAELCRAVGGGTPSRKQAEYFQGSIPWATVKDFIGPVIRDTQEHITEAALRDSAAQQVPANSVLVVTRVGLGKVAIAGVDLAINQDIKALIPTRLISPEYLFWWLRSRAPQLERMGVGATVKGITLRDLLQLRIRVPSPAEQRRIVDVLVRAEGIVRLRRQAADLTGELIPSLFHDMFGDPATNPKGWPSMVVEQIVTDSRYGPRFPDRHYSGEGAHILRTTDMGFDGSLRWQNAPILPMTDDELKKYRLSPGSLLITRTGATIGKTALFRGADLPCIAGAYLIEIRLSQVVVPEYVLQFFLSEFGQSKLRAGSRAVAQPNINVPTIKAIPIIVPSLALQRDFSDRVERIRSIQSQQEAATKRAEATFRALLWQSFGHQSGIPRRSKQLGECPAPRDSE